MKNPLHYFTAAALCVIVVLGCVAPRPLAPTASNPEITELKARIDAAVQDRRNWVDPSLTF